MNTRCTEISHAPAAVTFGGRRKARCVRVGRVRVASPEREALGTSGADPAKIKLMQEADYGFRTGASRLYEEHYGEVPAGWISLARANFTQEWLSMRRSFVNDEFEELGQKNKNKNLFNKASAYVGGYVVKLFMSLDKWLVQSEVMKPISEFDAPSAKLSDKAKQIRASLRQLKLDAHKVEKREKARFAANPPTAPWYIKLPYFALCLILDLVYEGRPIQRFWVLEEVARMPYFSYISMLHLYESLGWWRAGAALRKVHFAEEWNELHHLQIMESLGGDNAWIDRFIAQHAALVYFWFLVIFYAFSPKNAYAFSELVEGHASDTYLEFCNQNEELLKSLPPVAVAVEYYTGKDVYMFRGFMTSKEMVANPRQPKCENLYDVFYNIWEDEIEHQKTMVSCQDPQRIAQDLKASFKIQNEM